ncbi:uncharacterized protein EV154DRAFT_519042 [Mucor mucedo]|uniref:uncharacterized protein n=1 Tax=Mucor mucedo TaxID=29922 RepID=UPI00221F64A9|nr:uncharacterized protein EV154DRAFT_519042 [Mucor mucedo]KAI7888040.1 hypothetical protein EV154DRAFT_519042 [Mucor mucedo]
MEQYCDFSRYKHCISFGFDFIHLVSNSICNDDHNGDWDYEKKQHVIFPSIVYDIVSKYVVARGKLEVEKLKLKGDELGLCYVPNIFTELNNIFLRESQREFKSDVHGFVITQEVIKFLQEEINNWESSLKCSKSDFCYAFTLPTEWNYEIQEKLIRPLFISAGLINKHDHCDILLFFTPLESMFRYIQTENNYLARKMELEHGRQYVMCSLDFVEAKIYQVCSTIIKVS